MSFLASLLRPTGGEIHELVVREMDPARAAEFEPICRGPIAGVLALALVACACVLSSPGRLLKRIVRR